MPETIPVVILCGGRGTRMGEETDFRPKPMVALGNRPILWHIMKHYGAFGHRRFILCLGYKGDVIRQFFLAFDYWTSDFEVSLHTGKRQLLSPPENREDWDVVLAETGLNTQSGGRIKLIEPYIQGETFFLTYGDGVANVDLDALLAFHRQSGTLATVTGIRPPARFGEIHAEGDRVKTFSEKPQITEGWINGGFFVFQREVFQYLEVEDMLEGMPLKRLAGEGQLSIYRHEGFWQCMDTRRDLEHLTALWESGNVPWKNW